MVNISDIAKYTVLQLLQRGNTISPLKLQKILYYLQAWYLVYFDKALLFEDVPEAWVNGPVYRSVYEAYRSKGKYDQFRISDVVAEGETSEEAISRLLNSMGLSEKELDFVEAIYNHYGSMSHDYLVYLTHSQKPWNEARKGLQPFEYTDQKISLDLMYDYYSKSINR